MHPYRIFVSYSHEDRDLAEKLVVHLRHIGFHPVWDKDLKPGQPFTEAIKHGIAHAHVFLPILTEKSAIRPWVHQETGYALGLEIPVMPVAVGSVPDQMIRDLQARTIEGDVQDLQTDALAEDIEDLLRLKRSKSESTYHCAGLPEERADSLANYTDEALKHGGYGPLRQAGALTSFCLPNEPPNHEIWRFRDSPIQRGDLLYRFLAKEREALETYARKNGCYLIIDPYIPLPPLSATAFKIRLSTLLSFLEDTTVAHVHVVVRQRATSGNRAIVGDWFSAESQVPRPGKGYYQTIFTWHAPTVLDHIHQFDEDFASLLRKTRVAPESSRELAIAAVKEAIGKVEESGS